MMMMLKPMLLLLLLITLLLLVTTTLAKRSPDSTKIIRNDVLQSKEVQVVRNLQQQQCTDISGFSIYNATSGTIKDISAAQYISGNPKASIVLSNYEGGQLNIIVNARSCPDQPIQCMRITWGDFQTTYDNTVPYTLYGDINNTYYYLGKPKKTGFQTLEATAYGTDDCTGDIITSKAIDVLIFTKLSKGVRVGPLTAIYNGTSSTSASFLQTSATVKATCDYINQALTYGYLYKSNCGLRQLSCWRVNNTAATTTTTTTTNTGVPTLTVLYKLFPTFGCSASINPYINRLPPTSAEVTDYIKNSFLDKYGLSPNYDQKMSAFVKGKLATNQTSNPYYPYTNIIIN